LSLDSPAPARTPSPGPQAAGVNRSRSPSVAPPASRSRSPSPVAPARDYSPGPSAAEMGELDKRPSSFLKDDDLKWEAGERSPELLNRLYQKYGGSLISDKTPECYLRYTPRWKVTSVKQKGSHYSPEGNRIPVKKCNVSLGRRRPRAKERKVIGLSSSTPRKVVKKRNAVKKRKATKSTCDRLNLDTSRSPKKRKGNLDTQRSSKKRKANFDTPRSSKKRKANPVKAQCHIIRQDQEVAQLRRNSAQARPAAAGFVAANESGVEAKVNLVARPATPKKGGFRCKGDLPDLRIIIDRKYYGQMGVIEKRLEKDLWIVKILDISDNQYRYRGEKIACYGHLLKKPFDFL